MEAWRAAVIAEAVTWIRTPYHPAARVKGHGVDCIGFVVEVYERAGVTPHIETGSYPPDWHLHQHDERLLEAVLPRAIEVETPAPGDLALWKVGHAFAHAAIVAAEGWPAVIAAERGAGMVVLGDGTQGRLARLNTGALRPVRFFTPRLKVAQ